MFAAPLTIDFIRQIWVVTKRKDRFFVTASVSSPEPIDQECSVPSEGAVLQELEQIVAARTGACLRDCVCERLRGTNMFVGKISWLAAKP